MRFPIVVLSILSVAAIITAGCMEAGRDIDDQAKEREKYARDNDDHDVVAVLSGPPTVAPGALVWYSAYGSHDPDFLGATTADLHDDNASAEGYVNYEDDTNNVHFSWYVPLFERANEGLGTGLRTYEWRVDDGTMLHSFDLTHRYGSEDGPIRFPLGFPKPGTHTLRLTVTGWDGSQDSAEMEIHVAEGGTSSTINGWTATQNGWVHNRTVELEPRHYGECPPGSSTYDAPTHRVSVPWDLVYWMQDVRVTARWDPATEALLLPVPDEGALNLAEVGVTLGHCDQGDVWERFSQDQGIQAAEPRVEGEVGGDAFARELEVDGMRTDKTGAWDHNVFHDDSGTNQGGLFTTVDVGFVFLPATDTRSGGL